MCVLENALDTHSLMSLSCSYSWGFVKSGSWASRWIMYGTTYSGRRETSFSEGKGRMTRFNSVLKWKTTGLAFYFLEGLKERALSQIQKCMLCRMTTAVCNLTVWEIIRHVQTEHWPWASGFCLMYSLRTEMFFRRHCRAWARRSFTGSLAQRAKTARYSSGSSSLTRAKCNFWAKIWRTW